jgi:hypothetical protein
MKLVSEAYWHKFYISKLRDTCTYAVMTEDTHFYFISKRRLFSHTGGTFGVYCTTLSVSRLHSVVWYDAKVKLSLCLTN